MRGRGHDHRPGAGPYRPASHRLPARRRDTAPLVRTVAPPTIRVRVVLGGEVGELFGDVLGQVARLELGVLGAGDREDAAGGGVGEVGDQAGLADARRALDQQQPGGLGGGEGRGEGGEFGDAADEGAFHHR
nr:hypothetical protein [Nocardia neocaledoniensis]